MCDPLTATVLAVASTGASLVSQAKAAKSQAKAIRQQLGVVQEENRKAASAELFDQMRATRREQARIRAAAGEAGLSLESGAIEGLLMDSAMQGELQGSRTMANMESRNRASQSEAESMMSQVQKPTALGAGLQLASAGVSAWSAASAAKIQRDGPPLGDYWKSKLKPKTTYSNSTITTT